MPRKRGRPAKGTELKEEQVVQAILDQEGLLSFAGDQLGVTQQAISQWVAKSEACKRAQQLALNRRIDKAEQKLYELQDGAKASPSQLGAICFFLKCRAKDRGYIEKPADEPQEHKHTHKFDLEAVPVDERKALRNTLAKLAGRGGSTLN